MATNSMWGQPPRLTTTPSGGVAFNVNGNNVPLPTRSGVPVVTIIGDSTGSEFQNAAITGASYDASTGIATVQLGSAVNVKVGDVVNIVGMTDTGYDTFDATILTYSTSGGYFYTYAPSGTPANGAATIDANAQLTMPWTPGYYVGILSAAKFLSGARFSIVQRAIGGSEMPATITRFDRDVPSTNPSFIFLTCGINDIYNRGTTATTLIGYLDTLKAKSGNIGAQFGVIVPMPQNSARTNWSSANVLIHNQYRNAVHAWGLANNCPVFDTFTASAGTVQYLDSSNANGNPTTGFSIDNVHPSTLGAYTIGKKIAAWFMQFLPKREWLVAGAGDATNLINGLITGIGGSGADSGSVATNWTVSKSGVSTVAGSIAARTVAADGDTCGSNQVLTISGAASGASVTLAHSSVHASVANGDILETGMHLQVSSATDLKYIQVIVLTQCATSGNRFQTYFPGSGSNAYAIPEDFSGVIDIPALVRGPNATNGNPSACTMSVLAVFGTSGAGAATIKVGRATLRKKV